LHDWQNSDAYAALVVSMLRDNDKRMRLVDECYKDAKLYSNETMIEHFAKGIINALNAETITLPSCSVSLIPPSEVSIAEGTRAQVAILSDSMSHYREAFYIALESRLKLEKIALNLIYGVGSRRHNIGGDITWAHKRRLKTLGNLSWLPVLADTINADLVIIPQVLKQLHLYPHLWRKFRKRQKIALWGHGKVFSAFPQYWIIVRFKEYVLDHLSHLIFMLLLCKIIILFQYLN
jgi:hypothetical protein